MYQVLARKYRPRNFNELVGQNHVSRALTSALDRGRLHHAYLFTGTRGVGKTTIARILAKCLNCETGVTSTPCEVCATCKAVNEGRFIDLIEIDAASRTKVEDTRELLDNVPYAPTQGRFKVYLIDEVHMLSTHSFNALLKTLEEPPEHVKFLFATTDPQKLPITVISRCLQFTLRPLAVDEITHHLDHILNKEHINAEQDAIWQIAESAQGSLRDALSLTDQAIAYGQGAIHHQDVKEMLGLIDRTIIYDLILVIHQNQRERVSQLLLQFRQQALDVSLVLDQFISTLHELAMLQYLPELSLKYSAEINRKIMQLSQLVSAQDLQLYYQIACKGRAELQLAVTQEQGFEMTVLRLLAFRPIQNNEMIVQQQPVASLAENRHQINQVQTQAQPIQDVKTNSIENEKFSADAEITNTQNIVSVPEPSSAQNINSGFDPAFEDIEDELSEHHIVENEPSSDDFLDDEIVELTENIQTTAESHIATNIALAQTIEHSEVLSDQQITEYSAIQAIDEPSLSLFGGDSISTITQNSVTPTTVQQDVFFLAPETTEQVNQVQANQSQQTQVNQDIDQTSVVEVDVIHATDAKPVDLSLTINDQQSPQQILSLKNQTLEGDWTVDKWEYWFRNSELSPAVQELAQHGLMTGTINAQSVFQIPQKYEKLLGQAQFDLGAALKQQWENTVFSVEYGEIASTTPYMMQNERKAKAFQRAAEMLHQEAVVKSLVDAFDGQLHNIQLKS
ncbi:DNA polymerase III subunit gamma/tau [Acinetobacter rongchengensis]|uniref:DNA polymerase III subunit gamma/tau n=1 Tax=Acinetobacter rongchengensis TaxID=2419601 RepID=A0A3A8ESY1_9GAMM|nr:DNA polymerase III subunit gamma/tau [Acinetobacter rongchengensis]RKG37705.1 DNA polymerase III subunit gamma/tau [Acinetobacter rongchengensis]